ncbi:MAG: ABC transporter permease subunit [Anaerolineaceae bacterium]|nr:ABC transporter permease subunit [Anaerolineaceae bacterium]
MFEDVLANIWKEWKEVIITRSSMRGGWLNIVVIVCLLGIVMPLQFGLDWLTNPVQPFIWSWLPVFLAIGIVADAFAGERERHTLETLLASRLSDQAILYGKIAIAVIYSWVLGAAGMLLGAVTINIAYPQGGLQFYPLGNFFIGLGMSLLAAILISSIGVLVSLRAATPRQAYQRMSIIMLAFWLLPMFGIRLLPDELNARMMQILSDLDLHQAFLGLALLLLVADISLILIARRRFRRNRLILD